MSSATKIVYKDTHKGSEEFFVFAEPDMIKKWRKDKSIPLAQVLETFNVYTVDTGGNTGLASTPSKGTLESTFQTSNVDDICRFILERGEIKGDFEGMGNRDETKDPFTLGQYN